MSKNTVEENQRRHQLDDNDQVWLFGYGANDLWTFSHHLKMVSGEAEGPDK